MTEQSPERGPYGVFADILKEQGYEAEPPDRASLDKAALKIAHAAAMHEFERPTNPRADGEGEGKGEGDAPRLSDLSAEQIRRRIIAIGILMLNEDADRRRAFYQSAELRLFLETGDVLEELTDAARFLKTL